MYEREIGVITQRMAETLIQAEKDYPLEWFIDAFKEAVDHNARNWKYVEAILRRWQSQGKKDLPEKKNGKVGEKITITLPGGETTEIIRQ
jgi:DnaD/phage-associated family protein